MTAVPSCGSFPFDQVIVTFPDQRAADAASAGPLEQLQRKYPHTSLVATTDPYGARVGSGGGTLAALLEHVVVVDNNNRPSVLILHAGGESSRCPTQMVMGKAWTSLPCCTTRITNHCADNGEKTHVLESQQPTASKLLTPIELWLNMCQSLFATLPLGSIVVVASDCLMQLSSDEKPQLDWSSVPASAVVGLSVPAPLKTAKNHGVFVLGGCHDKKDTTLCIQQRFAPCQQVWQKPSLDILQRQCAFVLPENTSSLVAWIDTGVVVFLPTAAAALEKLAQDDLALCTRCGLEAQWNAQHGDISEPIGSFARRIALQVDLYTHILQALALDKNADNNSDNLDGRRKTYCQQHQDLSQHTAGAIFDALSALPLHILAFPQGHFLHLGTTRELHDFLIQGSSTHSLHGAAIESDYMVLPFQQRRQALCRRFGRELGLTRRLQAVILLSGNQTGECPVDASSVIYHCSLSSKHPQGRICEQSVVEHCLLETKDQRLWIGKDCFVSGLRGQGGAPFYLPDRLCVQMLPLSQQDGMDSHYVYLVLGMDDEIKVKKNLYGRSIDDFFEWSGLSETDLWDHDCTKHTLWTAQLHPVVSSGSFASVFSWLPAFCQGETCPEAEASLEKWKQSKRMSLAEIRDQANSSEEFSFREELAGRLIPTCKLQHCEEIHQILMKRRHAPIDIHYAVADYVANGRVEDLCQVLMALDKTVDKALEQKMYDVCGRACMIMSGLFFELDCLVRSGFPDPAEAIEKKWQRRSIYTLLLNSLRLSEDDRHKACRQMHLDQEEKANVQAFGEHMAQLAQAMTMKCVCGSSESIAFPFNSDPVHDQWVVATAPARIDLAGAWSDTPPVCCEFGGSVTGVAVAVDGQIPLSCRCRVVSGRGIALRSELRDILTGEFKAHTDAAVTSIDDLSDFQDPHSNCALLKCALVCLGLITLREIERGEKSDAVLQKAINNFCKSQRDVRLEVVATSLLPKGSGLGTSSILGGCVLAAIGKCIGKDFLKRTSYGIYPEGLMDAVSVLEQQLTTGGGFQDQANGLIGGFKTVRCQPQPFTTPLKLSVEKINVTSSFQNKFNTRVVLAFSGKTRLAADILRRVLNRWSKRTPEIVESVQQLVLGAERARENLKAGDLESLAATLNENWKVKKLMAGHDSGVEPPSIKAIISELAGKKLIIGGSLCGAGGGGFLALVMAQGVKKDDLQDALDSSESDFTDFTFHDCEICDEDVEVHSLQESDHLLCG